MLTPEDIELCVALYCKENQKSVHELQSAQELKQFINLDREARALLYGRNKPGSREDLLYELEHTKRALLLTKSKDLESDPFQQHQMTFNCNLDLMSQFEIWRLKSCLSDETPFSVLCHSLLDQTISILSQTPSLDCLETIEKILEAARRKNVEIEEIESKISFWMLKLLPAIAKENNQNWQNPVPVRMTAILKQVSGKTRPETVIDCMISNYDDMCLPYLSVILLDMDDKMNDEKRLRLLLNPMRLNRFVQWIVGFSMQ